MKPPRKRLKLTLDLDAHDWRHAESLLYDITTQIAVGEIRGTRTSGAGYHLDVDEDENAPGKEEFERLLAEWFEAQRT